MKEIHNVFCVGRNYALHAQELGNAVPTEPMIFSKPTHSIVYANDAKIPLPTEGEIHHELELVIRMGQAYSSERSIDEVIDSFALGLDLTLRDVQTELKKKGHPWLKAKGFKHSAILTPFQPFPGIEQCLRSTFSLLKNDQVVQQGNIRDMIFNIEALIEYCSTMFGLAEGDILFTGTPEGVGPLHHGDRLILNWNEQTLGSCEVIR